jgi:hypothetical protein
MPLNVLALGSAIVTAPPLGVAEIAAVCVTENTGSALTTGAGTTLGLELDPPPPHPTSTTTAADIIATIVQRTRTRRP